MNENTEETTNEKTNVLFQYGDYRVIVANALNYAVEAKMEHTTKKRGVVKEWTWHGFYGASAKLALQRMAMLMVQHDAPEEAQTDAAAHVQRIVGRIDEFEAFLRDSKIVLDGPEESV